MKILWNCPLDFLYWKLIVRLQSFQLLETSIPACIAAKSLEHEAPGRCDDLDAWINWQLGFSLLLVGMGKRMWTKRIVTQRK